MNEPDDRCNDLMLLESIAKNLYERSCHGDWSVLDNAKVLECTNTFYIRQCITETLIHNLKAIEYREVDVYRWFESNYKSVLGEDCEIVKRKNDPHHIPDFWILKNKEYIPVECKRNDFVYASLLQLQRYMDVYHADHGIAVAKNCNCELPENITFIKHDLSQGYCVSDS